DVIENQTRREFLRVGAGFGHFFSGRSGTSFGSYLLPFATWIMVIRTLVGKNFSGSGRLCAWPAPPLSSFITRCISLIPSSHTMQSFCQKSVIFTSFSYAPFSL